MDDPTKTHRSMHSPNMLKHWVITVTRRIKRSYWTAVVRKRVKSCGVGLGVNFKSKIARNTYLGNYVSFNGMHIKGGGKVVIGNHFHSGQQCLMISEIHNYDCGEAIPYDDTYIYKDIIIEDNVWLGDRVIVLGGSHIGEGAIIQAGSVVAGDIPRCAIAGGHPAKPFKYRDIEHYERLKAEGKFS